MVDSKRTIICLATTDWDSLFARRQQLMLRLARAGHPVHYRNPGQIKGVPPEEVLPRLWVYKDFDLLPMTEGEEALFFVYFPAYAAWIEPNKRKFIVYDCTDDFPEFARHEDQMLARADLVVCCSKPLRQKFEGRHDHVLFLPNGVDADLFSRASDPVPPEMTRIRQAGGAVIGFVGALCQDWVDLDLLYYLANARPEWQIVVVGDTYRTRLELAPSNVWFLGRQKYEVLPAFMHSLDAGIIPFRDNQIARGSDPIKLYEYLAAGLPVISRKLPFAEDLGPPLVYSFGDQSECLAAVEQSLADGQRIRQAQALRLEYARGNSWDDRVSKLLHELSQRTWLEG